MKLYYPEACEGVPIHKAFQYRYPHLAKGGKLFQNLEYSFFKEVETSDSAQAQAFVLVHDFAREPSETVHTYIAREMDRAQAMGKPLFLFSCGDFSDAIRFDPRAWVFRYSLYRHTQGPHDICVPMSTEDPPPELLFLREKLDKPVVAFCGNGAMRSLTWGIGYVLKNTWFHIAGYVVPALRARKLGVYWRRAMMRACARSPRIQTNFIVRKSFSGHAKSIELDPAQARKEYLESTAHADFVLAPKGDGNYSSRFYKTLAFGRIPVVVDTDMVLPLESHIDYASLVVRIPMDRVQNTANEIVAWYTAVSPSDWLDRQRRAREVYETRLRVDAFYRFFFTTVFPTLFP